MADHDNTPAARGALGGAANEEGSEYRANLGAYYVAHGLASRPIPNLDLDEKIPVSLAVEVDAPVDDLAVHFGGDTSILYVQAKVRMTFTDNPNGEFAQQILTQWKQMLRMSPPPRSTDRLLLAVNRATDTLLDLRNALDRRRLRKREPNAGKHSSSEIDALNKLKTLTSDLGVDEQARLFDIAFIREIRVFAAEHEASLTAAFMLEKTIVEDGHGQRAFSWISSEVRRLARERCICSMDTFLNSLARNDVPIRVDGKQNKSSKKLQQSHAIRIYRDRLVTEGSRLSLKALAAGLPDIELVNPAVQLEVQYQQPHQGDRSGSIKLITALRCKPRALLVGLPGSGKSTALQQLAGYAAARSDWPTPILAQLKPMAQILASNTSLGTTLLDQVLCQAVKMPCLAPNDRELVMEHLWDELRQGRALLLLDGLDECKAQMPHIIRLLDSDLRGIHPDVEVIVSTRPSAVTDAAGLGLSRLDLRPPANIWQTIQHVVRSIALEREIPQEEQQRWEDSAIKWIRNASDRDPILHETPMMPVLLALQLRSHSMVGPPPCRGKLLSDVIDDAVTRWEIRMRRIGEVSFGPLEGHAAVKALKASFAVIATAMGQRGYADDSEARAHVQQMLERTWGVRSAVAGSAAEDMLEFWDNAGFFPLDLANGKVQPRLPLLGEVGMARFAAELAPDAKARWIAQQFERPLEAQPLLLAAALDRIIAEHMVVVAAETRGLDGLLLAARAISEGAQVGEDHVAALLDALAEHLQSSPESASAAMRALVSMPVTEARRMLLAEKIISSTPDSHRDLVRCFLHARWSVPIDDFVTLARDMLRETRPLMVPACDDAVEALLLIPAYQPADDVAIAAVGQIERHQRDLASAFLEIAWKQMSLLTGHKLACILRDRGHGDLVQQAREPWRRARESSLFMHHDGDHADKQLLAMIAKMATPARLSFAQRRKQLELLAFMSTLRVEQSIAGWAERALKDRAPCVQELLGIFAALGSFDSAFLAAQAQSLLDEDSGLSDVEKSISLYRRMTEPRSLDGWEQVEDRAGIRLILEVLLLVDPWINERARLALWSCPDHTELAAELDTVLTISGRIWKESGIIEIGRLLLHHEGDNLARLRSWSASKSIALRRLASETLTDLFIEERAQLDDLVTSLSDEDTVVRNIAVQKLTSCPATPRVADALHKHAECLPISWTCIYCANINQPEAEECTSCNITYFYQMGRRQTFDSDS